MGIYLVTTRGLSAFSYGAIYLVSNGLQSIAHGYAGELSDRIGIRSLMVWSLALRSAVVASLGALVLIEAPIAVIAVVIVVSAVLRGGFEPVAYAAVADVVPTGQRVAAFGLQRMGTNLGWAIGPALGGLLADTVPYGFVFFCAAPTLLIAAAAVARLREPTRSESARVNVSLREAFAEAMSRSDVMLFLVCTLLFQLVHTQLFSIFPIYASSDLELSKRAIGLLYAVNGLGVLLLQVPAVAVISRLGNHRALIVGAILYVAAFLGFGAAVGLASAAAAVLVATIGEVIIAPAQQATTAEMSNPSRLGRAFGLLGIMQMVGVALGPVSGGAAYDHLSHHGLMLWSAVAGLASSVVIGYVALARVRR
jgi:predicted MFS family arabinose efflux permease